MRPLEQWIWLPESLYPNNQTTRFSERTHKNTQTNYTVAAFERSYEFPTAISQVHLRFSGDTAFALFCNGIHIANGPVLAGGDFLDTYADVALYTVGEAVLTVLEEPEIPYAVANPINPTKPNLVSSNPSCTQHIPHPFLP